MEEFLWMMTFRIVYDELGLRKYDEELESLGVRPKRLQLSENAVLNKLLPSRYFFLRSSVHMENLSHDEILFLENRYKQLVEEEFVKDMEILTFLKENKLRILLPQTKETALCWGTWEDWAPADAIVLAFHYLEFNVAYTDEVDCRVVDMLNEIQELYKKTGYKIAVIRYNEVPRTARIL